MGPWDTKLRWQPGGNFQPIRMTCEFNWRECPYAIGKYFWSEVYTDVVEFLTNNNEDLLLKGVFLFAISIILYSILYWKVRRMKGKKANNSILNKIAFDIQDLELRVDILSYKLQNGTWPSLQQITDIYKIEEKNKNNKLRLSVSATDNSKCYKNLWLKKLLKNNYLEIKSSCNLFKKFPSEHCNIPPFEDLKALPKTYGNINVDNQNNDKSKKEMQMMSNNFPHKIVNNKRGLKKVNCLDDAHEKINTKVLEEYNNNKEEIEKKKEKLLRVHEQQKNIENACEIRKYGELFYNNNDKTGIKVEEENIKEEQGIEKTENEKQNNSQKGQNMSNNLDSSAKLNATIQIAEENLAAFSALESIVPELEKHSLRNSKVLSQPQIIFNPPPLNNLPTIDSTLMSIKPQREKAPQESLEDVKECLENIYYVLQIYENQQELNSTELNEEELSKKLFTQTFIQELSDFLTVSESEINDKSNIDYEKKYFRQINPLYQLNDFLNGIKPGKTREDYKSFSVEDDSESSKSNQIEERKISGKCTENNITDFNKTIRKNKCNFLMLEQQNSITSYENLMKINEPLLDLQEDKSFPKEKENKFNKSSKLFINSKSSYQSNLSDIISESDQIEETNITDNHYRSNIIFDSNKIDLYYENDNNLISTNDWDKMVINSDLKCIRNNSEVVENETRFVKQLVDIFDSNSYLNEEVSEFFETVSNNDINRAQNNRNLLDSLKSQEGIFMNLENNDTFKGNLIDLNYDEIEENKNHVMIKEDQHHKKEHYVDIKESHHSQITDNVFENVNNLDAKILEIKDTNKISIKNNCAGMAGNNYLISGKTFIKENIKKTLKKNLENKSLIELHSINFPREHRISNEQYKKKTDNIGKTFKDIKSKDNLNSINVLPQDNSIELEEKMFDEKSDAENSDIILNKLLIKNNCENLLEIKFDVELEMQENSKNECENNSSLNTLSESSSIYLTGEASFSDISNNEKIIDLIGLNDRKENEITSGYNIKEEWKSQENEKKEDNEERITISSNDSAFYETPPSSATTINNINVKNNNENLNINTCHNNFNYDQYSSIKEIPQIKLKSPRKRSALEKEKRERTKVEAGKSSSISITQESTKLSDKKINHFPIYSNAKSNIRVKKNMKGLKQTPTDEHKRNDNLHKSKLFVQNDAKTFVKDLKANKLSSKTKSNLNLFNDFEKYSKEKGLEGRSKSNITPRKLDSTPRSIIKSLVNKKHQINHSLVNRSLQKNSESSKFNLCNKKTTMNSQFNVDSKSKSRESINKSWKSNIPILKSRMKISKDKNVTNNSKKKFSINESSLGDTQNLLSRIKSNENIQSYPNNFTRKNCIGLCKKFNQVSAECREVWAQETNILIKDVETVNSSQDSQLFQEAQNMIYVNIMTNKHDTRTKQINLKELLRHMKNQDLKNQSVCEKNNGSNCEMECNCSKLLALISTLSQKNEIVFYN